MILTDSQQTKPSERILIVDTDKMMCELLQYKLETEGYAVDAVHDGQAALAMSPGAYSLLLVDLMDCGEFNAIRLSRALREKPETYNTPIIVYSAKTSEDTVVDCFDAGADDFVAKPFSTRELLARIRSVLRRRRMMSARRMSNIYRYKTLVVDFSAGTVSINDTPVSLTRTEYLILAMFMRHRNQFFDRAEIQHEAWEDDSASGRAVDTNISRLRKKLGEYGKQIVNRQGFGYGFID